jgi:hypothetical protein
MKPMARSQSGAGVRGLALGADAVRPTAAAGRIPDIDRTAPSI